MNALQTFITAKPCGFLNLQIKVCERAERELSPPPKRITLMMDLDSCEESGTPLDLARLLAFQSFDFAHDITGIGHHMDRSRYPGKLTDCFVPRCARASKRPARSAKPHCP